MTDAWLGFLGGVVTTLFAGLIASLVQRHNAEHERKERFELEAYFLLIELNQWYFWVTTAELHGEEPAKEVLDKCRSISYQLNDKLREFDRVHLLEEVLTVLFDESIPSARERANRLSSLIEAFGSKISPKYSSINRRISQSNILRHGPGAAPFSNAPGSWRYRK